MDQDTINRYQPGGDIYAQLQQQFGVSGANTIAAAALTGDETQINAAISTLKNGAPLNTSTASIFLNQIETNPLAAPLQSLNGVLSNTFTSFLTSPAVLATAAVVLFFVFGGADIIRAKFRKAAK